MTYYVNGTRKNESEIPVVANVHSGNGVSLRNDIAESTSVYVLSQSYDVSAMDSPALSVWLYFYIANYDAYWAGTGDYNVQIGLLSSTTASFTNVTTLDGTGNRYDLKGSRIANGVWSKIVLLIDKGVINQTDNQKGGFSYHNINLDSTHIDAFGLRSYNTNGTGIPTVYVSEISIVDVADDSDRNFGVVDTKSLLNIGVTSELSSGTSGGGYVHTDSAMSGARGEIHIVPDPGYEVSAIVRKNKSGAILENDKDLDSLTERDSVNGVFYPYRVTEDCNFTVVFDKIANQDTTDKSFALNGSRYPDSSFDGALPAEAENQNAVKVFGHTSTHLENWYSYGATYNNADSYHTANGLDLSKKAGATLSVWVYFETYHPTNFYMAAMSDYMRGTNKDDSDSTRDGQENGFMRWNLSDLTFSTGWNKLYLPLSASAATIGNNGINYSNITGFMFWYESSDGGFAALLDANIVYSEYKTPKIGKVYEKPSVALDITGRGNVSFTPVEETGEKTVLTFTPYLGYEFSGADIVFNDKSYASINVPSSATTYQFTVYGSCTVSARFTLKSGVSKESVALTLTGKSRWDSVEQWKLSDLYNPSKTSGSSVRVFNKHDSKDNHNWYGIEKPDLSASSASSLKISVYIDDLSKIGGNLQLFLLSGITVDSGVSDDAYTDVLNRSSILWEVAKTNLVSGWNCLILPIDVAEIKSEFDWNNIGALVILTTAQNNRETTVAFDDVSLVAAAQTAAVNTAYKKIDVANCIAEGTGKLVYDGYRNGCLTEGISVAFTAIPDEGYDLKEIRLNGKNGTPIRHTDGTFTLKLGHGDELYVSFKLLGITSIVIEGGDISVGANDDKTFRLTYALNAGVTADRVVWGTTNVSVAEIDADGNVTVLRNGVVKISLTAYKDGIAYYAPFITLTVSGLPEFTGVELESEVELKEQGSYTLKETILGSGLNNLTLSKCFESSNESVARVSENGEITAVAIGETKITATYTINGLGTHTVTVTVKVVSENVDAPVDDPVDDPVDVPVDDPTVQPSESKGCSGVVHSSVIVALSVLFVAVIALVKKERKE